MVGTRAQHGLSDSGCEQYFGRSSRLSRLAQNHDTDHLGDFASGPFEALLEGLLGL
jgi:hypothetical protein